MKIYYSTRPINHNCISRARVSKFGLEPTFLLLHDGCTLNILFVQIVKIGMVERILDGDTILGIVRQEQFE